MYLKGKDVVHSPTKKTLTDRTKSVPLRMNPSREGSQDLGHLAMSSSQSK